GQSARAADPVIPLPDSDKARLETLLGAGVIGEAVPAPPLQKPMSYAPRQGAILSYQLMNSDGKKWSEAHHFGTTTDAQFSPGLTYSIEKVSTEYMQETPDGNLVVVGEADLDQQVLTRFTPGEPLIIAGLPAGQSRTVTVNVKVADLSDPTD